MRKIIVTTDLSQESKVAFDISCTYAKAFGAEIHLLTVVEDPAQAAMAYAMEFPVFPDTDIQKQLMDQVKAELQKIVSSSFVSDKVQAHVRPARGPVHSEIISFAKESGADLIVIATHGRTGIKHLLIGSIAERVARESECPVLVVPARVKGS